MRKIPVWVAVTIAFASWGAAGATVHAEPHEHAAREHVVIRIGTTGPTPAVRLATPDQAIVWVNYTHFPVRITLAKGTATRVHCREPSHFEPSPDGGLRAPWIEPLGAASLCLLDVGTYDYVIEELDDAARPPTPVAGGRRLSASISIAKEPIATEGDVRQLASYRRRAALALHEVAAVRDHLAELLEETGQSAAAADSRVRAAAARREAQRNEAIAQDFGTAEHAP